MSTRFRSKRKLNLVVDTSSRRILSRRKREIRKRYDCSEVMAGRLFWNALMTSVSYTMSNNSYNNLGVGLSFRGGPFQFYLVSDHIPVTFNKLQFEDNGDETSFPFPTDLKRINIRFGLNFVFGCNPKRFKDRPLLF